MSILTPSSSVDTGINANPSQPLDTKQLLQRYLAESVEEYAENFDNYKLLEEALNESSTASTKFQKFKDRIHNTWRRNIPTKMYIPEKEIQDTWNSIDLDLKKLSQKVVAEYTLKRREIIKKRDTWFAPLSSPYDVQFAKIFDTLPLEKLKRASSSAKNLKAVFENSGPLSLPANILTLKHNSSSLIGTLLHTARLTEAEESALIQEIDSYENNGHYASRELIMLALKTLDTTSATYESDARDILTEFLPSVRFRDFVKYKILSESEIEAVAKKAFKKMTDEMLHSLNANLPAGTPPITLRPQYSTTPVDVTSDEYKWFLESILSGDIYIDIDDFDAAHLSKAFFENAEAQSRMTDYIYDHVESARQIEEENNTIESFGKMKRILKETIDDPIHTHINASKLSSGIIHGSNAVDSLYPGNFILIDGVVGKKGVFRIENTAVGEGSRKGIQLVRMVPGAEITGNTWQPTDEIYNFPYRDFVESIIDNLSSGDINSIKIEDSAGESPEGREILGLNTLNDFIEQLDKLDPNGAAKNRGLSEGMAFAVKMGLRSEYCRVENINEGNKRISIRLFDGKIETMTWVDFLAIIEDQGMNLRRIGSLTTAQDFAKNAAFMDVDNPNMLLSEVEALEFHSGKVTMFNEADNAQVPVWGFKNEKDGTYVEVEFGSSGAKVHVTQFRSRNEMDDKIEDQPYDKPHKKATNKLENMRKIQYQTKYGNISYIFLLQLLQHYKAFEPVTSTDDDGKYDARNTPVQEYKKQVGIEEGDYMDEATGGSFIEWTSVGTIMYKYKHLKEYYKKKFEKKSEMKSAYAFINMGGDFGVAGRHAMSALINHKVEEVKEKYSGVERRKAIRHILDDKHAKPHEILAALILVYDISGTLYPDSYLQDLQGTQYFWFQKICKAIGVNPKEQLMLCKSKTIDNKPEVREHPPEEELIERLFKANQPNKFIQALGGGAKVWNAATEGRNKQKSKGETEVEKESSTAEGRAKYILAKMGSNEFEIALGALQKLMDLTNSEEYMGVMFALVAGGATNYVHYSTLKAFKAYVYSKGITFHGFLFSENREEGDTYRNTLETVLNYRAKKGITGAKDMLDDYNHAIKNRPNDPNAHVKNDKTDPVYSNLFAFWKKHHKVLHPIMQGVDPTMQLALEDTSNTGVDKTSIQKYLKNQQNITNGWFMKEGQKKYPDKNGSAGVYTPEQSMIYNEKIVGGVKYRSLSMPINALSFDSHDKAISPGGDRELVFRNQILTYLDYIKTNPMFRDNPQYQRQQFKIVYEEIMDKLAQKTFGEFSNITKAREFYENGLNQGTLKHFNMLEDYGFNISFESVYRKSISKNNKFSDDADEAFDRFIAGNTRTMTSDLVKQKIHDDFSHAFSSSAANDEQYRQRNAA